MKNINKIDLLLTQNGIYITKIMDENTHKLRIKLKSERKLSIKLKNSSYPKLNVLDLFCGCGGMTHGLIDAGLNVFAGIDIWNVAVESYQKNHNHLAICADLKTLSPEQFNRLYNPEKKQ